MPEWTYHLTPGEVMVAASLAAARQLANRHAGTTNLQVGAQHPMTTELVGVYGELAVCRLLNVYPDLTDALRAGTADAMLGTLSVDVKTTRHPNGSLLIDEKPRKRADVYVLAVANWTTVTAVGFATRKLDCIDKWASPQGGWSIPQAHLRPMDRLLKVAR